MSVWLGCCVGALGWSRWLRGLGCLSGRSIGFVIMTRWCGGVGRIRGFV